MIAGDDRRSCPRSAPNVGGLSTEYHGRFPIGRMVDGMRNGAVLLHARRSPWYWGAKLPFIPRSPTHPPADAERNHHSAPGAVWKMAIAEPISVRDCFSDPVQTTSGEGEYGLAIGRSGGRILAICTNGRAIAQACLPQDGGVGISVQKIERWIHDIKTDAKPCEADALATALRGAVRPSSRNSLGPPVPKGSLRNLRANRLRIGPTRRVVLYLKPSKNSSYE